MIPSRLQLLESQPSCDGCLPVQRGHTALVGLFFVGPQSLFPPRSPESLSLCFLSFDGPRWPPFIYLSWQELPAYFSDFPLAPGTEHQTVCPSVSDHLFTKRFPALLCVGHCAYEALAVNDKDTMSPSRGSDTSEGPGRPAK